MSTALDLVDDEVPPKGLMVALRVPPGPHVLVDAAFVTALANVEERVAALRITDATTNQMAADLLRRLTTAGTDLDKARKAMLAPFRAAMEAINEAASSPQARIDKAKAVLKQAQVDWDVAERKRIAAAEQARLAEIKRLADIAEAEAKRLKDEADRIAAAEAKRLKDEQAARDAENERRRLAALPPVKAPVNLDLEEDEVPPPPPVKTQAQLDLERALHAPVPVAAKAQGVKFIVTLEAAVTDPAKVPEPFIIRTVDLAAIRKAYCVGWKDDQPVPALDGVTFTIKRTAASTRQAI